MNAIQQLTTEFVSKLTAAAEREAVQRIVADLSSFGATRHHRGRTKPLLTASETLRVMTGVSRLGGGSSPALKSRKKPPVQLCPVPRCTGRAAPIYGMVCSKHKDVPKGQIKKYREARRARKARAA